MHAEIGRAARAVCLAFVALLASAIPAAQAVELDAFDRNGQGLLWRIERAGTAPSHVFGTVHLADARITTLPAPVEAAFVAARSVAVEVMFDPSSMVQMALAMMALDGRRLDAMLAPARFERLARAMAERGMPADAVAALKPWAAMLALIAPRVDPLSVLDVQLQRRAVDAGTPVHALETALEQTGALDDLPLDTQLELLDSVIEHAEEVPAMIERMLHAYLSRDVAAIWRENAALVARDVALRPHHERFVERLIFQRNARMVEAMLPRLAEGAAFIAIGALHLPGDKGVLARLEARGFRITRLH